MDATIKSPRKTINATKTPLDCCLLPIGIMKLLEIKKKYDTSTYIRVVDCVSPPACLILNTPYK